MSTGQQITPVINFLLQEESLREPLTDRSNIQCQLTLDSLLPNDGENIPVGGTFTATYSYEISERPLDVEVRVLSSVFNEFGGYFLSEFEGSVLVDIGDGDEFMSGQAEFSRVNVGSDLGLQVLDTLDAACIFFTIYDEEDALNNPGPPIGSRVQFVTPGAIPLTESINLRLEGS